MPNLRYSLWLLLLVLIAPGVAWAQLTPSHYQVRISFGAAELQAAVTVRVHTPVATRVVTFTLADSLKIDNVAIEGQTYRPARVGPSPDQRNSGGSRIGEYTLLMVDTWAANTDHELTFHYAGLPQAPDHVRSGDVLLTPQSGWYPQFQDAAPFTTEVDLRAPIGVQVVTRGELAQENSSGFQAWVDGQPGTSLGLVLKRGLPAYELDRPGLQVQAFCPSLSADDCSSQAERFGRHLSAYYKLLSRRYGQPRRSRIIPVVLSGDIQSLEGGPRLYFAPLPAAAWAPEDGLALATSISRLWWNLSAGSAGDEWLRQGLPVLTALWAVTQDQGSAAEVACLKWLQASARKGDAALQPASDPPVAADALPAQMARASLVLNALRLQVGAEHFADALTEFQRRIRSHPDAATTADFQKIVADAAHTRLDWFWSQWLNRPELPHIEFTWRLVRLPRSGQTVRVRVQQQGQAFGFRAPIVIMAGGKRYLQSIEVHNADTILGIPVHGKVDTVEFDPDDQLLRVPVSAPPVAAGGCPPAPHQRKRRHPKTEPLLATSQPPGCSSR